MNVSGAERILVKTDAVLKLGVPWQRRHSLICLLGFFHYPC